MYRTGYHATGYHETPYYQLGAVVDEARPGGGTGRRTRKHVPGITSNYAIAMREDEELIAMLQAWYSTKR